MDLYFVVGVVLYLTHPLISQLRMNATLLKELTVCKFPTDVAQRSKQLPEALQIRIHPGQRLSLAKVKPWHYPSLWGVSVNFKIIVSAIEANYPVLAPEQTTNGKLSFSHSRTREVLISIRLLC